MHRLPTHIRDELVTATRWSRRAVVTARQRFRRTEAGEGVISAAIAVLVMAFLGAGMWLAFNGTMNKAQTKVDNNVTSIGGSGGGAGATGP